MMKTVKSLQFSRLSTYAMGQTRGFAPDGSGLVSNGILGALHRGLSNVTVGASNRAAFVGRPSFTPRDRAAAIPGLIQNRPQVEAAEGVIIFGWPK